MAAKPLVSVLMRTRDRLELLQEAVASVCAQTWSPLEIIIVNDGGEDFSRRLEQRFASDGQPFAWLNNEARVGRGAAANMALDAATGEYCLFLDDDDWLDPPHIENLVKALRAKRGCKVAYSAVRAVVNGKVEEKAGFAFPFDPLRLLIENYIPINAVLFSRQALAQGCRFDAGLERFEDWDFWLQVAQREDFLFVNECTANYRVGEGSGLGVRGEARLDEHRLAIYRKWLPRWSDRQLVELLDRGREFPSIELLRGEIKQRNEHLAKTQRHVKLLQAEVEEKDGTILGQQEHLEEKQQHVELLQGEVEEKDGTILGQQERLAEQQWQMELLQAEVKKKAGQLEALHGELAMVYGSRSWRFTRPLREFNKARALLRTEGLGSMLSRLRRRNRRSRKPAGISSAGDISDSYHPLTFKEHEQPLVSIVIPVCNNWRYTFHCLRHLLANSGDMPWEVIVVDDCSEDETATMLAAMEGLKVIRQQRNQGFIHACNCGAQEARGEFLLLLNNDVEVKAGWLQALLDTFEDFPDAGLAGARLLFPDGALQEAGGIVWRDGSAWNYGRSQDPNAPQYSYCREADYCSGACLMLRRADFESLGGFDLRYAPAYYEDTDLAFRIRQLGKKVYYQPRATLIHFEGISAGADEGSGIKRYQRLNRDKFYRRWREVLQSHAPNGRQPDLEKDRYIEKRALVIDARVLMPDHDSGSLRMFNLLKIFQGLGYKVTFIPQNLHFHDRYTPNLQALGIECHHLPYLSAIERHLEDQGQLYDVALLSRADVAEKFIDHVKAFCPRAKVLFDTVDLHFLREQRLADLAGDKLLQEAAGNRKIQELTIARKADATLVVSPVEMELLAREAPDAELHLLSNIHEVHEIASGFHDRQDILFIGSFEHPPNADAMHYFIDEIFPLLHERKPEMKLLIIGGDAPKSLRAKASDHIRVLGLVADIQPLFEAARLSIAPLRYGAGVKGKINTSMSYGVPVVATGVAVEGLHVEHERDVLIADEPAEFASQILRVYDDEALWESLSKAGQDNLRRHFSFAVAERQLRAILPP